MGILDNVRRFLAPEDYQQAAIESMEQTNKFSPGVPILPNDGFSRVPRAHDFLTGYNIAARPRRNERVSFATLQGLIEAYDVAQMAITHRIDSVRSLDWYLEPIEGIDYDATEMTAYAASVLKKPDHQLPFRAWLSKFLWDVLAYDAGTLYRMRNNAGRCIGLSVVDGTTIAPLIDYHGQRPTGEAPAFVQFAQGVPWNWLTQDDIIYIPFRPMPNSPYGKSPLESILLNANTDLRFQNYFLSRFTEGTVPEGFANAPESWTPDQISDYQEAWDALMWGDETKKHQIRWVPGGTDFTWTREEKFDPEFSLFLMRKTAAAYHVTPNDLGFTDTVNLANGETQMDVQFRIGDLPLVQHVQDILTSFLQDDLGLPLEFKFNTGGEKEDRLAAAQTHKIYIDAGVVSPSVIAQEIYGLTEPDGQAVPRFIMTSAGPIPLNALREAAGQVDADTGAPIEAAPAVPMLAVQSPFTPAAGFVEKEATAGITANTGLTGSPMLEQGTASEPELDEQDLEDEEDESVAKEAELLAFRRFVKARRKSGKWRNFEFVYLTKGEGDLMNANAEESLRPVGLLCVHAEDTGRILLEQRLYDPTDPNAGKFDFPGGHLEDGEDFKDAAIREWGEEIGLPLPEGIWGAEWESKSGHQRGFVYHIARETDIDLHAARNAADPDAEGTGEADAILWARLDNLRDNPMVKHDIEKELDRIRDAVEALPLVKGWRESADKTPQHKYDLRLTDYYKPLIARAINTFYRSLPLKEVISSLSGMDVKGVPIKDLRARIVPLLGKGDSSELLTVMQNLYVESYEAGIHAGDLQLADSQVKKAVNIDWTTWTPGDIQAGATMVGGGLADLLASAGIEGIEGLEGTSLDRVGNIIAHGLAEGLPGSEIAQMIRDEYPSVRAEMIAHTESTRGIQAGTFESYTANGVGQWELLPADGACDECLALVGQNFPANDLNDMPPIHPYCRCTTLPVLDSIGSAGGSLTFDSLTGLADLAGATGWSPTMSATEADVWSNGSAITETLLHGTGTDAAVQNILENGFDLDRLGEGTGNTGVHGPGVYLTTNVTDATGYARDGGISGEGSVLSARVNVHNPIDFETALADPVLDARAEQIKATLPASESSSSWTLYTRALTQAAQEAGYDAFVVPGPNGEIKELVVFDPKKVTVVA